MTTIERKEKSFRNECEVKKETKKRNKEHNHDILHVYADGCIYMHVCTNEKVNIKICPQNSGVGMPKVTSMK